MDREDIKTILSIFLLAFGLPVAALILVALHRLAFWITG